MNKPIAAPSRTGEILEKYGIHAKKGYGQNFLIDVSVVRRCAEAAHCEGAVIEIGPGIGSLSEQLAMRSEHVRSYEIDERMIGILKDTLSGYSNVEIILQDIMETDIAASVRELKKLYGTVSVCANLPYYITTPILFRLFECGEDIEWITVMVQKEMGDRFSAAVGSADYGALTVECRYLYETAKLFQVSRNCFMPVPNVDSAVIQFRRRYDIEEADDRNAFFSFVRGCFAQRRKTILNNLKLYCENTAVSILLETAGIRPDIRPQNLSVEEYVHLYRTWRSL